MNIFRFLFLASYCLATVHGADFPSCIGYSKGSYSGDVTSDDECRTACETAEGYAIPDFKMSTCENENNATVTAYECQCQKSSTSTSRRGLCEDDVCAASGAFRYSLNGIVISVLVATSLAMTLIAI